MLKSVPRNKLILFSWVLLFASFFWLFQLSQSGQNGTLISIYFLAFSSYLFLIFQADTIRLRSFLIGTILLYLFAFWQLPFLSNDYFRFLWDGEMIHLGINPFDFTPHQIIRQKSFDNCYYLDLYAGMGELSRGNYSCYPTVNQFYFYISTLFSKDIITNVIVMRGFILLTLLFGIYQLHSILNQFELNSKRIFFFVLNPLVVLESMGNLHFELVTISFLLAAFNLLLKRKYLLSALLFAFAVNVKLIPLLLLPFLLPYLGWKISLRYYLYTGVAMILLFLIFIDQSNAGNFLMSLKLYFRQFEFDSFVLYPYLQYGQTKYGWNLTSLYAPKLAKWAFLIILGIAWNRSKIDAMEMFKRMFWATMIYYFLTSTVHPWYWVLPLLLSVFHFSWSILLATLLAICSYGIYEFGNQDTYRHILAYLNFGIMSVFFLEIVSPSKWKRYIPKMFLKQELN